MKAITKVLLAGAVLAFGDVAAAAGLSANIGATSDYRFRGVSQSARDPALQGGLDYAWERGFYVGAWGSTIDFDGGPGNDPDASLEVDLYAGYAWRAAGIDWDAGVLHYAYPGAESAFDLPFTEIYLGARRGVFSLDLAYTGDYTGTTDEGAYYVSVGAGLDIGRGYTVALSVGHSGGDGIDATFGDSYTDYRLGVAKEFAGVTFDLSYIDTSGIDPDIESDLFNSEGTVVLTVTKTF